MLQNSVPSFGAGGDFCTPFPVQMPKFHESKSISAFLAANSETGTPVAYTTLYTIMKVAVWSGGIGRVLII
tara:strand:+ start:9637 stop:9849 length:213 start_codon:yes stop_codon:yes gene_type:complete